MAEFSVKFMTYVLNTFFLHLSLITSISAGTIPGHYFLGHGISLNILGEDLIEAYQASNKLPMWTFNATDNYRIRFNFYDFGYYWNKTLLDIGDGLNAASFTRLASFGGHDRPNNVTSVSNAAWLKTSDLWYWNYLGGYMRTVLSMTVSTIPIEDTVRTFADGNALTIMHTHSSNNEYRLWDFRAPDGYFIAVLFEEIEIDSPWDDKTFLSFGENAHNFSESGDCSEWIRLNNDNGQFNSSYKKFASRSSSALLILSSFLTEARFSVKITSFLSQGNRFISETSNVTITSDIIFGTMPCKENCITFPTWTFTSKVDMELRFIFHKFLFYDANEFLEIGDGLTVGKDLLVHFTGIKLPRDVVAINNFAWVAVQVNCVQTRATIDLTVVAQNKTELYIEDQDTISILSSSNSYQYWNVHVPKTCVLTFFFEITETPEFWDNYTYLKVVEKDGGNSKRNGPCASSSNLIDMNGQFKTNYMKLTSRSSSVKVFFYSTTPDYKITVTLKTMQREDVGQISIDFRSTISITPDNFVKTLSCSEECLTWLPLTVKASSDLKVRLLFQEFNLSSFEEYLDIGDGIVIDHDARLARFSGATLPSNVTSVSNVAWINMNTHCGNKFPNFNITLTAVNISEITVEESTTLHVTSLGNTYELWNVRVPGNYVISLDFHLTDAFSAWDNFTFVRLTENNIMDMSDVLSDPCSAWVHLINRDGTFKPVYRRFTSRTSAMSIMFSSMTTRYRLLLKIGSIKNEESTGLPIRGNGSVNLSLKDFSKTLSCSIDCLKWQTLSFKTVSSLRINVAFLQFDFGENGDYFEFGDGLLRTEETRLARFGGSSLPSNVSSVSNAAWIIIASSCAKVSLELKIIVSAVDISETIISTGMTRIKSENFPSNYPNNMYRIWDIRAPLGFVVKLTFVQLDIEQGADFIYIGDGVEYFNSVSTNWTQMTGSIYHFWEKRTLILVSSSVILIFTSDGAVTRDGFFVECSPVDIGEIGITVYTPSASKTYTSTRDIGSGSTDDPDEKTFGGLTVWQIVLLPLAISSILLVGLFIKWRRIRSRKQKNRNERWIPLSGMPRRFRTSSLYKIESGTT